MALSEQIKSYTAHLSDQGLLRSRTVTKPGLIHFDSNDYLSLATDKDLAKFYQTAYSSYATGSGGSMMLNGYHANHQAAERAFAQWLDVDACILFPSGYAANLALTSLLGQLKAHCFIDKGVHASVYDGLRMAQVPFTRYLHNDVENLIKKITTVKEDKALITEGIFSMSGQQAPLARINLACKKYQVDCLVDEAHSIGVLGDEGKGAVAQHKLSQKEVPLRMLAFGKAFASQGALIAGQSLWINALLQAARSLIYSTSMSPCLSYGLLKTLEVVSKADDRRLKLNTLIHHFKHCISNSPLSWSHSHSAIQQLQLGCPKLAVYYAQQLINDGFSCSAVRAPTVSAKASGLRILINYQHQTEHITQLINNIHKIYENTSN